MLEAIRSWEAFNTIVFCTGPSYEPIDLLNMFGGTGYEPLCFTTTSKHTQLQGALHLLKLLLPAISTYALAETVVFLIEGFQNHCVLHGFELRAHGFSKCFL